MSESSDFESDKAKISINKFEAPMMLAYLLFVRDGLEGRELEIYSSMVRKFYPSPETFDFEAYFTYFENQLVNNIAENIILHCAQIISNENKLSVFCHLVDGVFSDDSIDILEEGLLMTIKNAFGIDEEEARQIIKVMVAKNKPTTDLS